VRISRFINAVSISAVAASLAGCHGDTIGPTMPAAAEPSSTLPYHRLSITPARSKSSTCQAASRRSASLLGVRPERPARINIASPTRAADASWR